MSISFETLALARKAAQRYTDGRIEDAMPQKWEVTVPSSGWTASSESWGDATAKWSVIAPAPGMTETTNINTITFSGGSKDAFDSGWKWLRPCSDGVEFFSVNEAAPAAEFTIQIVEVV